MSDATRGQVIATAAQIYDSFFVPALFEQWTEILLASADVQKGHRVLDVGCGTGALARAARKRVGSSGHVVAIDPNDDMLDVARHTDRAIEWKIGVAERLPFRDGSFDRTVSQFALMFCTDAKQALGEIARVTEPDGQIAVAVWDRLDNNTGYARLATLIEELFGPEAAQALREPFEMGDAALLCDIASRGVAEPRVTSHRGTARFPSLESWLHTEIRGWTLADAIDDDGFLALLDRASKELDDLVDERGVGFEVSALVIAGGPKAR